VVDGEIVALDDEGRPSFNLLQNYGTAGVPLAYFVFDVMVLRGRDVMAEPLSARRRLLETRVLPTLSEPVRYLGPLDVLLAVLVESARAQGFEALVAKRIDSKYEPGQRSGAWQKMRVNRGQEFVIGGYTIGNPFDALIFGYYDGDRLLYAARTRAGFANRILWVCSQRSKLLPRGGAFRLEPDTVAAWRDVVRHASMRDYVRLGGQAGRFRRLARGAGRQGPSHGGSAGRHAARRRQ
jgi:ATP-dependent DNA ligase